MERTPSLSDLNEIVYGQVFGTHINANYQPYNFFVVPIFLHCIS